MRKRQAKTLRSGVGQLSLVEHALCPLDSRRSLVANSVFETGYYYSDNKRRRRRANVRVFCPLGISPQDELYLWGMLALTLAQNDSDGEFRASRHFILRQLGIVSSTSKGGRQFSDLIQVLERLSCIQYQNDAFYDPVRAEHRRVSFGFFSYSMPMDENSSRSWRIVWDPIFFEMLKPAGGMMRFSLPLYRNLDVPSRRLFLFLAKLFRYRFSKSHPLELRHLGTDILGYSSTLKNGDLKIRVQRAIRSLQSAGILSDCHRQTFKKNRAGNFVVTLYRGERFNEKNNMSEEIESPFDEQLRILGIDERGAERLARRYPKRLLSEWIDITLAAKERFGMTFFKKCPEAYLQDNLKYAEKGVRTPPDWWMDIRKMEETKLEKRARVERANGRGDPMPVSDLPQRALGSFDDVQRTIFNHFVSVGQSKTIASENSVRFQAELRKRTN